KIARRRRIPVVWHGFAIFRAKDRRTWRSGKSQRRSRGFAAKRARSRRDPAARQQMARLRGRSRRFAEDERPSSKVSPLQGSRRGFREDQRASWKISRVPGRSRAFREGGAFSTGSTTRWESCRDLEGTRRNARSDGARRAPSEYA